MSKLLILFYNTTSIVTDVKISVITVCYNMAEFIERTIKSVIDQDYPNLEYIVIDGKSTDQTLSIVEKYKDKISIIKSEPDKGQYDAIQKGMSMSTGDIMAWLNADDIYFPWTLKRVGRLFTDYPDIKWASGIASFLDSDGELTNIYNTINGRPSSLISIGRYREGLYGYLQQESMFWRRELWELTGGLDMNYNLAADYELWTRFALHAEHVTIGLPLAGFRVRAESRSRLQDDKYFSEVMQVCKKLPRKFFLLKKLASLNQITNKLIRLLVWKKAWVYYFSMAKQKWILARKLRPVSTLSFSQLLLEK